MAKIVITDVGLAELLNASQSGFEMLLPRVGFGTGQYTAKSNMMALKAEFKRLDTVAGGSVGDNIVHLTITDSSKDTYTVYEVGVYTETGALFAVYSQKTPIVQKASGAVLSLSLDIRVTDGDPEVIKVGDTTFANPPATTTTQGIVELATPEETIAGKDAFRAVTPAALQAKTATTERIGLVELATASEAAKRTETSKVLTPAVIAPAILDVVYPVGSIYMSTANVDPSTFIGGSWKALDEGRVLIGANATYKAGSKGGEATHSLTTAEMPNHSHSASTSSSGSHTHTRGSMNITGHAAGFPFNSENMFAYDANGAWGPQGAFYASGRARTGMRDGREGTSVAFDASRSWSGTTSSNGAHTHTVTIDKTGQGVAHNNMQPYLSVYMWERVS